MVKTIGEYIDSKTVNERSGSPFLSLMGDEATGMKNRTELSVCMLYLTTAGCTNEGFLDIQNVPAETAEVITGGIISIIGSREIDFSKVVWLAFHGASNMSGHISGVQARMKNEKCRKQHMFTVEATFYSLPVFNHQKNLSLLNSYSLQ